MQIIGITVEDRPDGGIRIQSDDLPGLILSGRDRMKVLASVVPAAKELLRRRGSPDLDVQINATFMSNISLMPEKT